MTEDADPWKSAVGAWVRLADLWDVVEGELQISRKEAVKVLRPALEDLAIKAQVRDLIEHDRWHLSKRGLIALLPGDQQPSLTRDAWRALWREGRLNPKLMFNDVWVNWPQVVAALEGAPRISAARLAVAETIGSETALARWLSQKMSDSPDAPQPKEEIQQEAKAAGLKFSIRAFERAWTGAAKASGAHAWSAPGRRPKSPQ